MKVEGKCHCGKIAYQATIDPDAVRICHCADCQTLTGSAYRTVVPTIAGSFVLKSGAPKLYVKTAESGTQRAQAFCPDCGTPVFATNVSGPPNYSLRVGTIKERAQLAPKRQIWCRSALPWSMDLHGVEKLDKQ